MSSRIISPSIVPPVLRVGRDLRRQLEGHLEADVRSPCATRGNPSPSLRESVLVVEDVGETYITGYMTV